MAVVTLLASAAVVWLRRRQLLAMLPEQLGIVFRDDGGSLFAMAVVTLLASATVVWLRRRQLLAMLPERQGAHLGA
jgi:branched-subunit amino acid transport protein